jgi:hypothetical protein
MNGSEFIKSILALRAYRDAGDQGLDGMMAICFVFRNRVNSGWWGGDWIQTLAHHLDASAYKTESTSIPDTRNYAFQTLLQEIDGIFGGSSKDYITAPKESILAIPPRALYYAKLNEIDNPWFLETISRNHAEHHQIAQVGALTFFS